jgi:hypothetical protein
VNEYVPKRDDPRQVRNLAAKSREGPPQIAKGLADNFKLSLDRGAHHFVSKVVVKTAPGSETHDLLSGLTRIPQKHGRFWRNAPSWRFEQQSAFGLHASAQIWILDRGGGYQIDRAA